MYVEKIAHCLHLKDERGAFTSIINQGEWREVNLVESKKGAIRGNHYHKHTREYIYLIAGEAEVILSQVTAPAQRTSLTIRPGEGILIHPLINHTFTFTQDSTHLALLSEVFVQEDPDLHQLD